MAGFDVQQAHGLYALANMVARNGAHVAYSLEHTALYLNTAIYLEQKPLLPLDISHPEGL